jgi:hypothetical protein
VLAESQAMPAFADAGLSPAAIQRSGAEAGKVALGRSKAGMCTTRSIIRIHGPFRIVLRRILIGRGVSCKFWTGSRSFFVQNLNEMLGRIAFWDQRTI